MAVVNWSFTLTWRYYLLAKVILLVDKSMTQCPQEYDTMSTRVLGSLDKTANCVLTSVMTPVGLTEASMLSWVTPTGRDSISVLQKRLQL